MLRNDLVVLAVDDDLINLKLLKSMLLKIPNVKEVLEAKPNKSHQSLVSLEKHFNVQIITQNIDDLHERAGSTNTLHLHGQILNSRSTKTNKN